MRARTLKTTRYRSLVHHFGGTRSCGKRQDLHTYLPAAGKESQNPSNRQTPSRARTAVAVSFEGGHGSPEYIICKRTHGVPQNDLVGVGTSAPAPSPAPSPASPALACPCAPSARRPVLRGGGNRREHRPRVLGKHAICPGRSKEIRDLAQQRSADWGERGQQGPGGGRAGGRGK